MDSFSTGANSATLAITSFTSRRANRISGCSVTFVPDLYRPNFPSSVTFLFSVLSCAMIFSVVSGIYGSRSVAPITMLSTRLYRTVFSLSFLSSSFASAQGIVSSMYLLHLLNSANISVIASATLSLSMHSATLYLQSITTFLRSSSTGSVTLVFVTMPPKYLFDIDMVLLTRFPSVFASSELSLSTMSSHEITPSFSNGIS